MNAETANPLRARRRELGLTVERVAVDAELSVAYLYDLEQGKSMPGLPVARRLATTLKTTIDVLWPAPAEPSDFLPPKCFLDGDAA